ncbi:MAG: TRAP transporter substrate-binding protein [Rhodoferax sp.]|nr:TRAP transporter substrate-binding protein [Rhodoferax sp.]MDP3650071.1 TRAP transporter substrate-binding protein [Rhodoferax sp.]
MKLVLIAALCAAGVSHVSALHAQTTWTVATGYRAESFHTENIAQFGRDVQAATQGELKLELAPNGSLFKLGDILQAVQDGKVQAGETIMTSLAKDIPIAGADAVPFVVGSYQQALRLWQLQRPGMEQAFAQRGLKILFSVPWPPQGLYSTRPVKTTADFKHMKMRTYNQTTVRIAEMLGAVPVDVAMVDVGKAVNEGRLDAMITSAVTGVENKVWGPIKYYYELNAWFPKNIVFVNAKNFDALAPAARAVVLQAAAAAEARGWAASQSAAVGATKELQANGIKVERLSSELDIDIKRMGDRFSREWVRSVGKSASSIFVSYYFN